MPSPCVHLFLGGHILHTASLNRTGARNFALTFGRRPALFFSYGLTLLAVLPLYATTTLNGMVASYCLMQFGVTWAYITAYVVASEILPTRLRATGLGLSVAIGRVGAMLAPVLLTSAYQSSGNPSSALAVLVLLAAPGPICALLWWMFGSETRNISLEAGSGERAFPAPVAAEEMPVHLGWAR